MSKRQVKKNTKVKKIKTDWQDQKSTSFKLDFDIMKIFVGGLPKSADEQVIAGYFSSFGNVVHVQLNRDLQSGLSKGYCFVTFENSAGAESALACYDQHCIAGKWVEVKQYEAKEQQQAQVKYNAQQAALNGVATALQAQAQQAAKAAAAAKAGKMNMMNNIDMYTANLMNNLNLGMMNPAMNGGVMPVDMMALNMMNHNNQQQHVRKLAKVPTPPPVGPIDENKIFVGGLPKGITEDEMRVHFQQFGEIREIDIKKEQETGTSRGFGFVIYEEKTSAKGALDMYDQHELKGKWVEVKAAVITNGKGAGKGMNDPNSNFEMNKVFVGGLPSTATEDSIRTFFSRYGNILEVQLKKDDSGKPRGFGFVIYDSVDSACAAIANYAQNIIDEKWVEVKQAEKVSSLQAKSAAAQAALAVVGGAGLGGKGMGKGNPHMMQQNVMNAQLATQIAVNAASMQNTNQHLHQPQGPWYAAKHQQYRVQ